MRIWPGTSKYHRVMRRWQRQESVW